MVGAGRGNGRWGTEWKEQVVDSFWEAELWATILHRGWLAAE